MDISALVYVHITAGTCALLSGGTALVARKGERLHRTAGNVFFVAMLAMAAAALPVALVKQQNVNVAAASFTLYLVATAWMAAIRRESETGRFETVAMLAGASIGAVAIVYGSRFGAKDAPFFYGFGSLALFAALMDASVIARGGVSGAGRLTRHLWRMSIAMFIATGSFFLGQQKVMPEWIRGSPVLFVPVLFVLGVMLFWLVRVRLKSRAVA